MANRFDWNALEDKIKLAMEETSEIPNRTQALTVISLQAIFGIDIDEAFDSITDGGNDRGCDALYIDDEGEKNDIHIFQVKCVNEFSKSSSNFPGGEVDKITSFLEDLLTEDHDGLSGANEKLKLKVRDAIETLSNSNATVTVHFLGNLASLIEDEKERILTKFSKYTAVKYEAHTLDSLSDFFLQKSIPNLTREIAVVDTDFFIRSDKNLRSTVATVQAIDLVNALMLDNDKTKVDTRIFDQNVRIYLKKSNRINSAIIDSALSDDNYLFWYRNNGLTITCDKMEIGTTKRNPKIKIKNIQIVNGGQTSNCLFEAYKRDPDKLNDVLILVRIIETEAEDVKLAVSESTNSQTPINIRDLKSNSRQQRQLEDMFADYDLYYERKLNQHQNQPRAKRVDALSAGQSYLAYGLGLPEVALKDRGRVFGNLYETVFHESITPEQLYMPLQLMRSINQIKSETRKKLRNNEQLETGEVSIIYAAFHVLFALKQIAVKNGLNLYDYDSVQLYMSVAINIVRDIYIEETQSDENFSPNRFFKDAKTKDKITRKVD